MSILVIGDLHIKKNNLSNIKLFHKKLEQCILTHKPNYIIFLGDLLDYHDIIHTICLNHFNNIIDMCRQYAHTYVIVGNHDMLGPTEFLNDNHWLNAHKKWDNITIVDRVINIKLNNIPITLVPFVENGRFIEALNTTNNWTNSKLIFAHQEFKGCKMGAIISEDGDNWPLQFPQIISGHIHSKQQPQDNIYYTGSAIQHAFGESSDNTLLFIHNENNMEEIDLQMPKKKTIYIKSSELDELKLDNNNDDEIKVTVSGTIDEFKLFKKTKKYKQLVNNKHKVVFKNTRKEIKDEADFIQSLSNNQNTNFKQILYDLVQNENNQELINDYKFFF